MESKSSLPRSQQSITVPNLNQINPVHALPSYFSKIYFNIIPSTPGSYKRSLSFRLPHHKPTCTFAPYMPHAPLISFMYLVRWRLVHAPFLPWDGGQRLPASGLNTHTEYVELISNKQTNKQTNKQRVIARKSTGDTEGNASDLQPPLIPRNDTRLRKHTDGFPCPIFFQMIIFWVSQRVICVICFDVSEVHTAATSNSYGFNSRSLVPGE